MTTRAVTLRGWWGRVGSPSRRWHFPSGVPKETTWSIWTQGGGLPGVVLDRNRIFDAIWGYDVVPESRTLDQLV